jgi:hypothetical protein
MATESSGVKRFLWFSLISLICSAARGQGVGGNGVPGAGSGGGSASISPNGPNGMNPTGSAVIGTNYSSNQFIFQGNYCTAASPCNPASDIWGFQDVIGSGSGPNPAVNFTVNHNGSSGAAKFVFQMPVVGLTAPAGDNTTKFATTASVFNSLPSIPAQFFGAYGDAYGPPDGCITVASSTTVDCPDSTFVPTDVGKQFWEHGAGAGGVAFNATITSFIDAAHVIVSAAPSISLGNTPGNAVYGHDDTVAVQACWQYSASQGVQCTLRALPEPFGGLGFTGFLIGSAGLQLVSSNGDTEASATNTGGSSSGNGTTLFCEFNGDCVSLAPGPIPNAVFSNISLVGDSTQPNGRAFHFNAAPGTYGNGGLWFSTFTNVNVQNFNLECMLSEGGNYASGGEIPNQVNTFINFNCNAPNQMHTANLIKMTGQHAQITFINGQTNGPGTQANQPNAMILITEQTSGHADSATDVKFYGYTYEVGTIGLQLGSGAYNIHYDNSYVEQVAEPLIAGGANGVYGLTYNGNHIANSGSTTAVAQFTGNVTGSMRDNLAYGASPGAAAFAVCTGTGNSVDFVGNYSSAPTTTGCATSTASPSGNTLTVTGGTSVSVAADATPIVTINAPLINSGKTLTLYASGTFSLASGGNINLGGLPSLLTIAAGQSVTLTLFDLGPTWVITSTTAVTTSPPSLNSTFFDDFYTGANMASDPIGSPTGSSCSPSNTYTDNNHPGNMLLTAGTAGTGTGIVCGLVSENNSVTSANTAQGWTWETAVYVPVLPGTTVGAYQAGMAHTPNANPWTTGIGFYLSSANGVVNDWYCRYNSTSTDSGVAATVAWSRLTMVNDGTNVHWYIGGTQVCGTGVAIGSMPSTTQFPAVWSATALSGTSVTMAYDYINWQRAVSR